MRAINKIHLLVLTIIFSAIGASGQDARLRFDNLAGLEKNASEIVEVNVDGKLLQLAKRVLLKVKDADAKKVGQAIEGLEGVYVRSFNFENDNDYNMADVDAVRSQLSKPGWEKLAQVRSKKKNQKVDVFMMFRGQDISGLAVILSEKRQVSLINVIGPIDIDTLVELSGKMNIPEISISKDSDPDNDK